MQRLNHNESAYVSLLYIVYHYCIFIWGQINFGRAFWYQSSQTCTQITISGLPGYWNILTWLNCIFRPLLFLVNWGQYILQSQAMLSLEYQTYSLERYMYIVDSLIIFKYIFFMHHHPGWSWYSIYEYFIRLTFRCHDCLTTVNDLINAHSQINAPYLIDAPLEVYSLY